MNSQDNYVRYHTDSAGFLFWLHRVTRIRPWLTDADLNISIRRPGGLDTLARMLNYGRTDGEQMRRSK